MCCCLSTAALYSGSRVVLATGLRNLKENGIFAQLGLQHHRRRRRLFHWTHSHPLHEMLTKNKNKIKCIHLLTV